MNKHLKLAVIGAMFLSANAYAGGTCDDTFSAWDNVNTGANPANDLSTTDVNPLEGSCSLFVPMELGGKRYVEDLMPEQEQSFRMSFKIDPNSLPMPTAGTERRVKVASVLCIDGGAGCGVTPSGTPNFQGWWQTKLRLQPTGYKLGSWAQDDSGARYDHTVDLIDGCNTVEIQLVAGNPGIYRMWVNNTTENTPDFEVTTADFSSKFTDSARIGKTSTGTLVPSAGAFFLLDSYESRRQTFIGNSCAP